MWPSGEKAGGGDMAGREGRWGEADTWPAECQLLPDDSGMSEPKWSGPGTATVAHPAD